MSSPIVLTSSPLAPALSILAAIALGVIGVWLAFRSFRVFAGRPAGQVAAAAVGLAGLGALLVVALPLGLGPRPKHPRPTRRVATHLSVVSTFPEDGETNVPVDTTIVLHLGAEAAGLPRHRDLSEDGRVLTVTTEVRAPESRGVTSEWVLGKAVLTGDGRELRFTPNLPLRPGHTYDVYGEGQIGPSGSAGGCRLERVAFKFATAQCPGGTEDNAGGSTLFHPERIHVGVVHDGRLDVVALPGALASPGRGDTAGIAISAARDSREICSVRLDLDTEGGFRGQLGGRGGCVLTDADEIIVSLLDTHGNTTHRFRPSFRLAPGGESFIVPPEEPLTIETREGLVLEIPAGALSWVYRIGLHRSVPTSPEPPIPTGLSSAGSYALQVENQPGSSNSARPLSSRDREELAHLTKSLRVLIPTPDGTDINTRAFWGEKTVTPTGDPVFALISTGGVVARAGRACFSNRPELQPDRDGETCAAVTAVGNRRCLVAEYLPELRRSCEFTVLYERDRRWALVLAGGFSLDRFAQGTNAASPEFVGHSWQLGTGILMAVPADRTAEIEIRDISTGWHLVQCRAVRPDASGRTVAAAMPM